jgi:hypothetical protein
MIMHYLHSNSTADTNAARLNTPGMKKPRCTECTRPLVGERQLGRHLCGRCI